MAGVGTDQSNHTVQCHKYSPHRRRSRRRAWRTPQHQREQSSSASSRMAVCQIPKGQSHAAVKQHTARRSVRQGRPRHEVRVVGLCAVSKRVTCSITMDPDTFAAHRCCDGMLMQKTLDLSRTLRLWSVVCVRRLELQRLSLLIKDCVSDRHCRVYIRQSCPHTVPVQESARSAENWTA